MSNFQKYIFFCCAIVFVLIVVWLIIEIIFYKTHQRPLNDKEIQKLMEKRRDKYINENYSFVLKNIHPNKMFKSSMRSSGKFYASNIPLSDFPTYTANLLKWKKHEWVVLAFVKNKTVEMFYANKGEDNSCVTFNVNIEETFEFCKENGYQTIMRFHNHPNSNPSVYTCLLPSKQDKYSSKVLSELALQNNINWLDFICERGNFIIYWKSFSNLFYPETSNYDFILEENKNKKLYYKLQRELGIFRFY